MAAHDVNPILSYLDQVVYLAPGGTVSGTPEQVVTGRDPDAAVPHADRGAAGRDGQLVVVGVPDPACGTPTGTRAAGTVSGVAATAWPAISSPT